MIILQNLYIQNYRNIKETSFRDFKSLNIFIGPNNCGKSNLLKCINHLCNITASNQTIPFCEQNICSIIQNRINIQMENSESKIKIDGIKCEIEQNEQYLRNHNITLKYSFFDSIIIDRLKEVYNADDQEILDDFKHSILKSGKNTADRRNNDELINHLCKVNENKNENDPFNPRFTFILKQFDDTGLKAVSPHITLFCISEIHNFIKKLVCFIGDNRLEKYKDKILKDYIRDKNIEGVQINKLMDFLRDIIDPKIKDYTQNSLDLVKDDGFITSISEQGSGIRSLICLAVDILTVKENSIVLIDEPEIGLNPHSKQEFLKFLINESKSKQIFMTTHDPTFVNPTLWKNGDVAVYLYSSIKASFIKINLDESKEDPSTFAGYLPHTTSLKGIHVYVEGASDVYIFQIFLRKYLINKYGNKNWSELLNNVGIYHLSGNSWKHMLNTIPKDPYKCIVILDGDKKKEVTDIDTNFKFCSTIEEIRKTIDDLNRTNPYPVYCLEKNKIELYLDSELKADITNFNKKIDGQNIAEKMDNVPDELVNIFDILLSNGAIENVMS